MSDSRLSRITTALLCIAILCAGYFALSHYRQAWTALASSQEHFPGSAHVQALIEYNHAPMTAGPFPTTSVEDLVAHFSTEPARQAVARWTVFTGHPEWKYAFYANLSKATLRYAPAGPIRFYGIGSGNATTVLPLIAFGMPRTRTEAMQEWITANEGALTCWSVPITPDTSVGVLTLTDALFLPVAGGTAVK